MQEFVFMIKTKFHFLMAMSLTVFNNYSTISVVFCYSNSFDDMIALITTDVIVLKILLR